MHNQSHVITPAQFNLSVNVRELSSQFGTHENYFEQWVLELQISSEEINYAIEIFDKRTRFKIVSGHLKPSSYLIDYPFLLGQMHTMEVDLIQSLPDSVYSQHLTQLKRADNINNRIRNRSFPYQDYYAEAFCAIRHLKTKSELMFVRGMFTRSISHHSYVAAKQKLHNLVNGYGFNHSA